METCPVCKAQLQDPAATECPKCGVIFEKWHAKVAAAVIALERPPGERKKGRTPPFALIFLMALMVAVLWAAFSLAKIKERAHEGAEPSTEGGEWQASSENPSLEAAYGKVPTEEARPQDPTPVDRTPVDR